jgi:hypothetical protein
MEKENAFHPMCAGARDAVNCSGQNSGTLITASYAAKRNGQRLENILGGKVKMKIGCRQRECFYEYKRWCKRCGKLFIADSRKSKICIKCYKPSARWDYIKQNKQ